MSKCQSPLRSLIQSLRADPNFPRERLRASGVAGREVEGLLGQSWQEYVGDVRQYREVAMLLFLGLDRNAEGVVEKAVEFIEGMVLSRLIMLVFDREGQFVLDRVVMYLEAVVEMAVLKGLETGKERQLLAMLGRINAKERRFNEVGFILELGVIRKIQKMLEEESLQEFNEVLKGMLSAQKAARVFTMQNALHFRHIAILRQEQDRLEHYYLQFANNNKLIKLKEPSNGPSLPNWVQQAFWRMPKSLNLADFKSSSPSKVFTLLSEVQVFASSPIIQDFGCFTEQEAFLSFFEQFLMGQNISQQPYQFHWEKMQKSLQIIRRNTQGQNPCYFQCVAKEAKATIESSCGSKPQRTRSNF